MVYDERLAARVRSLMGGELSVEDVEEKKMFGGVTFMVKGQMCCGVLKDDLIVKMDPASYEDALARPGARPFDFSGRPMPGMVYVASSALEKDDVLQQWVRRGIDFVVAHPKTQKQKAKRR
jgi:TfoX/Sxy family transcriptional regulator of competence genes